jgi:hypothetical protein
VSRADALSSRPHDRIPLAIAPSRNSSGTGSLTISSLSSSGLKLRPWRVPTQLGSQAKSTSVNKTAAGFDPVAAGINEQLSYRRAARRRGAETAEISLRACSVTPLTVAPDANFYGRLPCRASCCKRFCEAVQTPARTPKSATSKRIQQRGNAMSTLTIMLIRHGEKPPEKPGDEDFGPGLTEMGEVDKHSLAIRGWQRAGAWAALLGTGALGMDFPKPDVIYAVDPVTQPAGGGPVGKRAFETIRPLSQRLHIEPVTRLAWATNCPCSRRRGSSRASC